jgi:uncharacterized SAM-dependent methyltransferase
VERRREPHGDASGQPRRPDRARRGREIRFKAGETIHTESSYKYAPEMFVELARRAGWKVAARWISDSPSFGVFALAG